MRRDGSTAVQGVLRTLSKTRKDQAAELENRAQTQEQQALNLRDAAKEALSRPPSLPPALRPLQRIEFELKHKERARQQAETLIQEAALLEARARQARERARATAVESLSFERLEARLSTRAPRRGDR